MTDNWAVIPVKGLTESKTRLSTSLQGDIEFGRCLPKSRYGSLTEGRDERHVDFPSWRGFAQLWKMELLQTPPSGAGERCKCVLNIEFTYLLRHRLYI